MANDRDTNQPRQSRQTGGGRPDQQRQRDDGGGQVGDAIKRVKSDGFYKGDRVDPDLFDKTAKTLGSAFANKYKPTSVSSNQMRAFYNDARAIEMKLQEMTRANQSTGGPSAIDEAIFHENEYLVHLLGPKVAYIQGKQTGQNVSIEFREFIEAGLANVKSAEDFQVFMRLFESVVGYYYGFGGGKVR